MLLSEKQESFCVEFVRTGVASTSYLAAGYVASTRNSLDAGSSRLLNSVKVRQRIDELRAGIVERNACSLDAILAELEEIQLKAILAGQYAVAVTAILGKARLLGFLLDRRLARVSPRKSPPVSTALLEPTEAEWRARFAGDAAPRALPEPAPSIE